MNNTPTNEVDVREILEALWNKAMLSESGSDWNKVHIDHAVDRINAYFHTTVAKETLKARIDELKWADDKFDSLLQSTEDGDRVHPGEYYEAIEERIKKLEGESQNDN